MSASGTDSAEFGVLGADEALRFLDEVSAVLAGSLRYETTLGEIARAAVPLLADWCAVNVLEDDDSLRQITSVHPDPEQEAFLLELRRRFRAQEGSRRGVRAVIASGEPELAPDVRASGTMVPLRAEESELYERLAARSYLIVPLVARGRTIGALTLLSSREGRHYGAGDVAFAGHLARRFALAIDNARLYDAAERSLGLLDTFFATAPVGLAFYDTRLRRVRTNEALAAAGDPAVLEDRAALELVVREGVPVRDRDRTTIGPDGAERHWQVSYTPVLGLDGQIIGAGLVAIDVTDPRRALEAERAAARRANFLSEAAAVLDRSLDVDETISALAKVAVPAVADWCTVELLGDDGRLRQVAIAHPDEEMVRRAHALRARVPRDPRSPHGAARVIRTGEPIVAHSITDEMLQGATTDDEELALWRALGLIATVIVPLQSRGVTFGALTFVAAGSDRVFDDADVELFGELGRRAGVAIENARLYTERSRIAHSLQARLLPRALPDPPGMQLAARYRAAGTYNEVGGDFYDAFERAPGEWCVVIGDVSGKGPEAAAVTALARYTIRSAATNDWPPAQVLERLNEALLAEDGGQQFVTVALVYLSASGDGVDARIVLAGHPPPYALRGVGAIEQVGTPGMLLGMSADVRLAESAVRLGPGDSLLLYTDGVTEAGPRDDLLGEDGLAELLAPLAGEPPERLVEAVERAAVAAAPDEQARDDIALVAVHVTGTTVPAPSPGSPRPAPLEISVPASAEHLQALRTAVVEYASVVPGLDLDGVRLAVAEACTNAVVHGYPEGTTDGTIRVRAEVADEGLVVEVSDDGGGLRPRPDSPGMGLGLPLMARLTKALDVQYPDTGGTTVRLVF